MDMIPYGKQHISEDDIQAVLNVLKSDFITQGPKVQEFEDAFAQYVGAKYAVAVSNGTAALHLCTLTLDVQPGDKVITTPITFAASANCVRYCGGEIDFVDIDPDTYLIDLDKLEKKLSRAKKGEYKGIIPVDFAGYPFDLEKLKKIADQYNLWIIEDACHAPGGYFNDSQGKKQKCGNGKYADLAIFSFHPVKHITTGEGGMITTNNEALYNNLLLLRNHGITKDPALLQENHGGWYYEMQELGYNYRITDIQCALGISQLKTAAQNVTKRNDMAVRYHKAFQNTGLILPKVEENVYHAYHLYVIQNSDRKKMYQYLKQKGIITQVHYIPLHYHPYYRSFGWKAGDFPISEKYYNQCLSLPMYPALTSEEQDYVIENISDFLKINSEGIQ